MPRTAPPRVCRLLIACAALLALAGAAPADDESLALAVEHAVDLPDPAARAKAAKAIAARPDASVPDLVAAMTFFGRFEKAPVGPQRFSVPLWDSKAEVKADVTVYVPPGYDPAKPAPALLALHGAGGIGDDEHLRWKETADALSMLVIAPTDAGANKGYGYTEPERAVQMSALRFARRRFNIDENRIFLTGISRGGHLAWDLAIRHPDVFAGIAPMIGGPRLGNTYGENNLRFLENLRRMPIRDLQGDGDDPLLIANLRLAFDKLAAWHTADGAGAPSAPAAADAKLLLQPGLGHEFDARAVDWKAWLGGLRRDPSPADVIVRAIGPGARSHWVEVLGVGKGATAEIRPQVDVKAWNAADDTAKRRIMTEWAEKVTARLEVKRSAPGVFEATSSEITSFRLLLTEGTFEGDKPVVVKWKSRTISLPVKRDARVLLADFVERFDRTFLPVAEALVK